MSWMQKLYRTYEAAEKNSNLLDLDKLAPLWHSPQTAHIQISLDGEGNFLSAKVLTDKPIVMLPVTESSEGRTSGLAPHALADSLQYIARDLGLTYSKEEVKEIEGKNGKKKKVKTKKEDLIFNLYIEQLDKWCLDTVNPKVLAIQKYLHKGSVLEDLIKEKIIPTDANGNLLDNWIEKENKGQVKPELFNVLTKEQGKFEIRKALVIWSVEIPKDLVSATWEDKSVQQDWGRYYQSTLNSQFCIITGNEKKTRESHPAKLTYTGDKAKLVSSNDKEGYTYRGRFETANQASSISAEVSHKSHAALRWLIARQGIRNGDQVTVAWAIGAEALPSPLQDNYDYLDDDADDGQSVEAASDGQKSSKNWSENIGRTAAAIIKKKLHGYRAKLDDHQQISLLMLDSATPGRMALTYYQEFLPDDYFANLDAWVDDFSWYQRYSRESKEGKKTVKRTIWPCLPPSPYAIYETIYGKAADKDGKIKRQLYARLLPVIAGGQTVPMPDDLVRQSFQVACQPSGYEHWEWERNIGVACALYKGWRARHYDSSQKRTYSMDLDIENRSRDYLFGRLLAVAEKLESTALRIADEDRATTAERYMQRFVVRPLSTWLQIEANLTKSYKDRLRNNRYMGFLRNREKEIDEIMFALNELRDKTGCSLDAQLDGEFLLGYHSQKMAYRNQSNAQAQPDTQETETENN